MTLELFENTRRAQTADEIRLRLSTGFGLIAPRWLYVCQACGCDTARAAHE